MPTAVAFCICIGAICVAAVFITMIIVVHSSADESPLQSLQRRFNDLSALDTGQHGLISELADRIVLLGLTEQLVELETYEGIIKPDARNALIRQIEELTSRQHCEQPGLFAGFDDDPQAKEEMASLRVGEGEDLRGLDRIRLVCSELSKPDIEGGCCDSRWAVDELRAAIEDIEAENNHPWTEYNKGYHAWLDGRPHSFDTMVEYEKETGAKRPPLTKAKG